MAHFYGWIKGQRGEASRLGNKSSGLSVTAASWAGAIEVTLERDEENEVDRFIVRERKWHGSGNERVLATGIIGDKNVGHGHD